MIKQLRNRYFLFLDLLLLPFVAYSSFALRLDNLNLGNYAATCLLLMGLSVVIIPGVFMVTGDYSRYWPFASIDEMLLLTGTLLAASVAIFILGWIFIAAFNIPDPPRSIPALFGLLALVALGTPRAGLRLLNYRRHWHAHDAAFAHVLIMGAGQAGAMVAQELRRNPQLGLEVVGFLDKDPAKFGMRIHGLPVLGNRFDIARVAQRYNVRQVIIALPSAPGRTIREIVQLCEAAGVQARTIPGLYELIDGKVSVNQLRKVEIEDLLRREPVQADIGAVKSLLHGRRVLITGGGGSIGSELCRQVLKCGPAELIVIGHGENSVFEIDNELRRFLGKAATDCTPLTCKLSAVIADLRMPERMQAAFERYRPQVVFHAAAHKHVPLMELNPSEAIMNNVAGTRNVLKASLCCNVEHFVLISTDKAVNPTSIMGASKRAAELLVLQAARASGKPYVAVRFGNVLGSRGSVVLTFRQQIAAGGPLTVTHPDMRRFFMTIPEAVQLVLQAAVLGLGGEIFTLDMGEPVKMMDLASDMIRLSGLEVGRDIDVEITGIRPGEKLFEELFIKGEEYRRTAHQKIFIAANASKFVPEHLDTQIDDLEAAARRDDTAGIYGLLHRLIAGYQPIHETPSEPWQPEPKQAMPRLANTAAHSPLPSPVQEASK